MWIQIGTTKYTPTDLDLCRQFVTTIGEQPPATVLAPLFSEPTWCWLFPNQPAFQQTVIGLAARTEQQREQHLVPLELTAWRHDPSAMLAGGTVKVIPRVFASADALAASDLITALPSVATLDLPAVRALVTDPSASYRFASWTALSTAIGAWTGVGAPPVAVTAGRIPARPKSVLANWDPTIVVTKDNLRDCEHSFETAWGNCGQTAEHLIGRLHDLGGDVQQEGQFLVGQGQGRVLADYLLRPVTKRTLINISNRLIHEFVIEKRPGDQQAILQQGYLSAYNAIWWAGLDDSLISAQPETQQALREARDNWGPVWPINLDQLGDALAAFLAAPTINSPAAALAWRDLPFHPLDALSKTAAPSFDVITWSVNAPDTVGNRVTTRLGGALPTAWVTQLVMFEIDEFWRRIQPIRSDLRKARLAGTTDQSTTS